MCDANVGPRVCHRGSGSFRADVGGRKTDDGDRKSRVGVMSGRVSVVDGKACGIVWEEVEGLEGSNRRRVLLSLLRGGWDGGPGCDGIIMSRVDARMEDA